jgi:hypothetical protein
MEVNFEDEKQEILVVHDQHELNVPSKRTYKRVNMDILVYDITSNYLIDGNINSNLGKVLTDCLCDEEYFINIRGKCCF